MGMTFIGWGIGDQVVGEHSAVILVCAAVGASLLFCMSSFFGSGMGAYRPEIFKIFLFSRRSSWCFLWLPVHRLYDDAMYYTRWCKKNASSSSPPAAHDSCVRACGVCGWVGLLAPSDKEQRRSLPPTGVTRPLSHSTAGLLVFYYGWQLLLKISQMDLLSAGGGG